MMLYAAEDEKYGRRGAGKSGLLCHGRPIENSRGKNLKRKTMFSKVDSFKNQREGKAKRSRVSSS